MKPVGVTDYTKQAPHKCCGRKNVKVPRVMDVKMSKLNIQNMRKHISKLHKQVHIFNMSGISTQGLNKKELKLLELKITQCNLFV